MLQRQAQRVPDVMLGSPGSGGVMSEGRKQVQSESRSKALAAGAATAGAVTLGVVLASPIVLGIAAVPAAMLTYRWWKHRAVNGIRF